ncbi:Gp49 family protein [Cronobacter dublinensis]
MSDKDIEQEIQVKGLTAPRITPQHIESVIISEHYFTAAEGVYGANELLKPHESPIDYYQEVHPAELLLTFCVLVLRNGFTVTGESACASPENFDAEIWRKIARENAVNKIWLLEGYLLKQNLSEQ